MKLQSLLTFSGFLSVCSLLACSNSSPKLVVLDVRTQPQSIQLSGGSSGKNFWIIPFSSQDHTDRLSSFALSSIHDANSLVPKILRQKIRLEQNLRDDLVLHHQHLLSYLNSPDQSIQALYHRPEPIRAQTVQNYMLYSPFSDELGAQIEGVLKASSFVANIYVDSRYETTVSSEVASRLLNNFSSITLPRLRQLFGVESDIDGSGKIDIFLSSKLKLGESVVGFFRPSDLLPSLDRESNEREILYVRIPDDTLPIELFDATIAHEAFHLINFNQKTLQNLLRTQGRSLIFEDTFLNE
ncbi:MAG: hypothetical protein KDD48_08960, partial [Bdellovibrionales bacterium]|nr:hypothetical protein [Bdellovibrionales bacterium]